jgi:hypothetical protein
VAPAPGRLPAPPRSAVYAYFQRTASNGAPAEYHDRLRDRVRESEGRPAEPTAAIIDSQSVSAAESDDFTSPTGYLLTIVSDLKQDASQLLVLDASGLEQIAAVHLPRRVTAGIHGSWIPDTDPRH